MSKNFLTFEFKVHETKEQDGVGIIDGYASTFGNVDLGMDVVDRGAFSKTIKDKGGKFPILLDHDPAKPIGWNVEAVEDDYGLKVKGEVQLITEEAKNRYMLAKRARELGTKMGLSIGYTTIRAEPDPERPVIRRLKELKLWEYSFVTFPMNPEASITNAKNDAFVALVAQLQKSGYDLNKLGMALAKLGLNPNEPAAESKHDPEILQSVDKLIRAIRG